MLLILGALFGAPVNARGAHDETCGYPVDNLCVTLQLAWLVTQAIRDRAQSHRSLVSVRVASASVK